MPWGEIPVEKLEVLDLFGYETLDEDANNLLVFCDALEREVLICKKKPFVHFKDMGDAIQLGVIGVIQVD